MSAEEMQRELYLDGKSSARKISPTVAADRDACLLDSADLSVGNVVFLDAWRAAKAPAR